MEILLSVESISHVWPVTWSPTSRWPKTASNIKSENPLIFFAKTENQMLKYGESANRNEYQNQKTEFFWHENRKTVLKDSQNRKTENPNAPLYDKCCYLFVFRFSQMRKGEILPQHCNSVLQKVLLCFDDPSPQGTIYFYELKIGISSKIAEIVPCHTLDECSQKEQTLKIAFTVGRRV